MDEEKTVTVKLRDRTWQVPAGLTAKALLQHIGLNPQSYLVTVNNELVNDDRRIEAVAEVRLVAVISGGTADTNTARKNT